MREDGRTAKRVGYCNVSFDEGGIHCQPAMQISGGNSETRNGGPPTATSWGESSWEE